MWPKFSKRSGYYPHHRSIFCPLYWVVGPHASVHLFACSEGQMSLTRAFFLSVSCSFLCRRSSFNQCNVLTVSHSPDPYVTCMGTVAQLSIPMVADQHMLALQHNENRQDANVHQQEKREHRVRGVAWAAKSLYCKYSVTLQSTA